MEASEENLKKKIIVLMFKFKIKNHSSLGLSSVKHNKIAYNQGRNQTINSKPGRTDKTLINTIYHPLHARVKPTHELM